MGPTASGKTALACELASHFPFEIISVDSAMVYRDMDIGTAKPSAYELASTPHHLIDILNPPQSFSAAQFCEQSLQECKAIIKRGNIPLFVGGTMMYFHALQQGLSCLPKANDRIRASLLAKAMQIGWPAMHQQLQNIDPVSAAKIHPHDTQRIQRALEIYQLTNTPLSVLLKTEKKISSYQFINYALIPTHRSWLHERIAKRFQHMLQQGFISEVEQLLEKWHLPVSCPAIRCVGYRQAYDYLAKKINYDFFCQQSIIATRQLAKRQLTWLRHWSEAQYIACDEPGINQAMIAKIHKILDTIVIK
jgi:tRNA dimethylallyltransferase